MGLAAAANYPAPFVQSGAGDVAVVIGANSADMSYATTIAQDLSPKITTGASTTTVTGGDSVLLERGRDKFNLGDALNTHYTTMDYDEFTEVLAKGTYLNDDNNEYKYEQKIEMSSEAIQFFKDSNFNEDKPIIGFNFDRGDLVLNYTLSFTTAAEGGAASGTDEYPKIDNTKINFLGKDWFISDAEYTTNGIQLTLLDSANTNTIKEGETKPMTVGGKSYTVSIDSFSGTASAGRVKFIVNGETTNALAEGQTYKLSDGTYVGVKEVSMRDVAGTTATAEFSLGNGKLVLEHNTEVQINDKALSELEDSNEYSSMIKTYFTNSTATNIDKMVLEWKVNTRTFVAPGTDLIMPGFDAIKLSMANWNVPSPETTVIDDDGDSVRVSTTVKDGDLNLNILYANSSITGFEGIGASSTEKLVTNSSVDPTFVLNETENSYFVATWISGKEAESYAYEIGTITLSDGKNATKLTNLVSGGSNVEFSGVGDQKDVGQLTFTLVSANDADGTASVKVSGSEAYGDLLASVGGMVMRLPVATNAVNYTAVPLTDGQFNTNASAQGYVGTTWVMNVTEADKDGNVHTGSVTPKSFTVSLGLVSGEGTEPTDTSLTEIREERSSDYYAAYVASDLATKVRLYKPSSSSALNSLEITYAGSESYANVYLAEASATSSGSGSGLVAIRDTELTSTDKNKNLIVVGGSCINQVAASLLGSSVPMCGAEWEAKTGAGAGKFIIQSFASPYSSSKTALLVAGYDLADTQKAVTYLVNKPVDTTVGKKYAGTSATEATLVV